jgi:hypothetical protein
MAMVLVVGLLVTNGLQAAKNAPRMVPDNFSALAEQVAYVDLFTAFGGAALPAAAP